MSWDEIWPWIPLAIALAAAATGLLLVEVSYRLLRGLARKSWRCGDKTATKPPPARTRKQQARIAFGLFLERFVERLYRPIQLLTATFGAWIPVAVISELDDGWEALQGGLEVGMLIAAIWVAVALLLWFLTAVGSRFTFGGSDTARRFRSQIDTLGRVISIVVVVAVVVVALVTVDQVRTLGTTVLAGAGLIGAIAGLAAQKTLANTFAGIAIGFNNALNIGDVVEVDGESGEIVERTLTYVVLKLSDQRRMVLPTSRLLDTPHRSWKLTRRRVVGWVPLEVDWTVPVEDLEAAHQAWIKNRHPGDEDTVRVEVIGVADGKIQIRAMVIDTPDDLWSLQCDARRHLIGWISENHPAAMPRVRTEITHPDPLPAADTDSGTPSGSSKPATGSQDAAFDGAVQGAVSHGTGSQGATTSGRKSRKSTTAASHGTLTLQPAPDPSERKGRKRTRRDNGKGKVSTDAGQ